MADDTQPRTSYFTFGPVHVHDVGGVRISSDCIVAITAPDPRAVMLEKFGREWAFEYDEEGGLREAAKWGYRVITVA